MGVIRSLIFSFYSILNFLWLRFSRVKYSNIKIDGFLLVYNKGKVKIGEGSKINSHSFKNLIGGDTRTTIIVKKDAELIIGKNFGISNSAIYCAKKIYIGNNVMIGGSCKIWDTDFHSLDSNVRKNTPNDYYNTKPIIIEDDVFIGGSSIILKGVKIGKGSIVGAGSVVTKSIPSMEVWAGNPAKFIKKLNG